MIKVAFVHNVYDRPNTLIETIKKEKKYYPNSKIIIAYNNKQFKISLFEKLPFYLDINFIYFPETTHKIGCTNGFILGLKALANIDCDVIVFSHDDVSINEKYLEIFENNILKIAHDKCDVICRSPIYNYGENYIMMECVFMNKSKIMNIIKNILPYKKEEDIPKDIRKSISPEVFIFNLFLDKNLTIHNERFDNTNGDYNFLLGNSLGVFHKNIGTRAWKE